MHTLKKIASPIALLIAGMAFAIGVNADGHGGKNHEDIIAVATEAGSFSTLLTALDAASLTTVLEGEGPFTVFAPTDEAFAALPAGALEGLLADPDQLAKVLTLHVVSGQANAADIVKLTEVVTVEGSTLPVGTTDGVHIGGAKVVTADVPASNGVIHVIDQVILPQS